MADHHRLVDMGAMFEDATKELERLRAAFGIKEGLGAAGSVLAASIYFIAEHTGSDTVVRILRGQTAFIETLVENQKAETTRGARH